MSDKLIEVIAGQIFDTFEWDTTIYKVILEKCSETSNHIEHPFCTLKAQFGFRTRKEFIDKYVFLSLNDLATDRYTLEDLLEIPGIGPNYARKVFADLCKFFLTAKQMLEMRVVLLHQGVILPPLKLPRFIDSSQVDLVFNYDINNRLSYYLSAVVELPNVINSTTINKYNPHLLSRLFGLDLRVAAFIYATYGATTLVDLYRDIALHFICQEFLATDFVTTVPEFFSVVFPELYNLLVAIDHINQYRYVYSAFLETQAKESFEKLCFDNYIWVPDGLTSARIPLTSLSHYEFDGVILKLHFLKEAIEGKNIYEIVVS